MTKRNKIIIPSVTPVPNTEIERKITETERKELFLELIKRHPLPFLSQLCFTLDEHDAGRPVKPYPAYPILQKLINDWMENRILLVLKSRQVMVTWTIALCYLWEAMLHPGKRIFFQSKKEEDADANVQRCWFAYQHLPDEIKELYPASYTYCHLKFPQQYSEIRAVSQNPDAICQFTASGVFGDELALQEYAEESWYATKPALEGTTKGRFTGVSTPRGKNFFYRLVASKQYPVFQLHYSQYPGRDEAWKKETQKAYSLPGGRLSPAWERDYELSFTEIGLQRIFEGYKDDTHLKPLTLQPQFTLYRAWDFGFHKPAVVWCQRDEYSRLLVLSACLGNNIHLPEFVQQVKAHEVKRFGELLPRVSKRVDVCDPSGACETDKSEKSSVAILRKHGIQPFMRKVPPKTRIRMLIALCNGRVYGANGQESPTLLLDPSCECDGMLGNLVDAFRCSISWDDVNGICQEEMKRDGTYEHVMDALQYAVIFMYPVTVANTFILPGTREIRSRPTYDEIGEMMRRVKAGEAEWGKYSLGKI